MDHWCYHSSRAVQRWVNPARQAAINPSGVRNTTWLETRLSEMCLKPTQLPKDEKALPCLRIIDRVDNIVPREDEKTTSMVATPSLSCHMALRNQS